MNRAGEFSTEERAAPSASMRLRGAVGAVSRRQVEAPEAQFESEMVDSSEGDAAAKPDGKKKHVWSRPRKEHPIESVHYLRAKLSRLLEQVELVRRGMKKETRRTSDPTKKPPTPRTFLIEKLLPHEWEKIKVKPKDFFPPEYPDLITFFEQRPPEVDDLHLYMGRLKRTIAAEIAALSSTLPAVWQDELAGRRAPVLLKVLDDRPPTPPEIRPLPKFDPSWCMPCQRETRGFPAVKPGLAEKIRAAVVREREQEEELAKQLLEGFAFKVLKNEFKVRQQKEAEKEGRKRLLLKQVISKLTAQQTIELMDADQEYYRQQQREKDANQERAGQARADKLDAVIASRQRENEKWARRRDAGKRYVMERAEAYRQQGLAKIAEKAASAAALEVEKQNPTSSFYVENRNRELKYRIVRHNLSIAEKNEEVAQAQAAKLLDRKLQKAAARRRLDHQSPGLVNLRAEASKLGRTMDLGARGRVFARKMGRDPAAVSRWSSAPQLSRAEDRWHEEFPPTRTLVDANKEVAKCPTMLRLVEEHLAAVREGDIRPSSRESGNGANEFMAFSLATDPTAPRSGRQRLRTADSLMASPAHKRRGASPRGSPASGRSPRGTSPAKSSGGRAR